MSEMDESLKHGSIDIGRGFARCEADMEETNARKKQKTRHEEEVRVEVGVTLQEDAEIEGQKEKQHDSTVIQLMESTSAPTVENHELESEDNQELVDLNHSASIFSPAPWKTYDVFLSFRGTDTRRGFVSHLYHELQYVKRIETFKDDRELEIGDPIGETLLNAIEESHFAIVVLSENYAQSAWCLEELTKICQCMKDKNRILPLFYHVEPTNVRYQKKESSFGVAFTNHVNSGRYTKRLQQWSEALEKVADLSGWNVKNFSTDREVVEAIVEFVCSRLRTIESEHIVSSKDFESFEATRNAMVHVNKALKDENVIVGVYGMGGIGKTIMVEHVAVEACKQGIFRHVTMAVISQKPNLWQIQETLASMLGVTLEGTNEFERAKILKLKIMRREKILIILDDIWKDIKLSDIGIPSLEELKSRNSKVLITTRNKDVFSHMQCQADIHLNTLNEADSWSLFEKNTGMAFDTTTKLYDVARKVAGECAGLPLALKTVAKALGGKSKEQWKVAHMRLKASKTSHPEDKGDAFKSIKLSYDYLDDDSKLCFLLCCLFPEDYDIQIEDLLKYGIGKGLFQESNMQVARDSICSVVQYLKNSNLLLDGKTDRRCARMHDVIRDVGLSISLFKDSHREFFVQAGWELELWPTIDAHEYYTAISLVRNNISKLPEDLVFPKLKILLLQSGFGNTMIEIPVSLFQPLEALRVLDISDNKISLPPSSSNLLTSLHTLCLDHCLSRKSNISLLGQLKQLKILSMREYPGKELPKEIGQLTTLKLLDFTSESVEIVPSKVIGNLSKLEELYMQSNFADWESSGEETTALFEELIGLLHLHILKVFLSDAKSMPMKVRDNLKWKNFDICIAKKGSTRDWHLDSSSSCDYSRALTLDITMITLQKWFIDVVTKKTEKLQYIECPDLCDILVEYDCGKLHKLKHLSVIGLNEKLKKLMNTKTGTRTDPVFQKLEELHLDKVICLEELCDGDLPPGSLCNLRLLKVRGCIKLMNALLQSNLLQRLHNLEKLSCEEMDEVKYVFSSEGSEVEENTLPKLIEMRLQSLGKLIKIWNGPAPCGIFHHVKTLVVSKCNKLKNLFTSEVAHHLHDLEDLSVQDCQGLERVIEASEEMMRNKLVLPKLKKLALKVLPKLTRFYGSTRNATNDEDEENIEFPLLEHSVVERCNSFKSPAKLASIMTKTHDLKLLHETGHKRRIFKAEEEESSCERMYGHPRQ